MKIYSVHTFTDDLLYTDSRKDAIKIKKMIQGAKITGLEVGELGPGETFEDAWLRAANEDIWRERGIIERVSALLWIWLNEGKE